MSNFWEGGRSDVQDQQEIKCEERAADIREGRVKPTDREVRELRERASKSRMTWGDGRP